MKSKIISALTGLGLILGTSSCAGNVREKLLQNKILSSYEYCIDGQYDNDTRCLEDDLQEAIKGVYPIVSLGMTLNEDKQPVMFVAEGTGILFSEGNLLTAYHMVGESKYYKPIKALLKTKTGVIQLEALEAGPGLEALVADPELDFAFMKLDEKDLSKLSTCELRLGNKEDLKVGNVTYIVGNAFNDGINMREGMISQLDFSQAKQGGPFDIGLSNGGNSGDSGGPVFAIRDGKIELVGMVIAISYDGNNLTYAIGINRILDKTKELTKRKEQILEK